MPSPSIPCRGLTARHSYRDPRFLAEEEPHLGEAETHPPLHGTGWQIEHLRYLGVGEPPEVRELDHLALVGRELVEGGAHLTGVVAALDLGVGRLNRGQALGHTLVGH